ncbi:MAG: GIY-YIG nuclease family protein [Candidatus Moraniibacteriota bacterium]
MAFVYILQSKKDSRFYVGSTNDLERRISEHKNGKTPSTKRFGGIELVFNQEYVFLNDARRIERKLKKLKRRDYLEKIIQDGFIKIKPD